MVEIRTQEFSSLLGRKPFPYPMALFFGPDRGLVSERATRFAQETGVDLKDDFSVVRIEAGEVGKDSGRLIDEANAISLFGGDRLVWIRNATNEKGLIEALAVLTGTNLIATYILIESGDLKKTSALRKLAMAAKNMVCVPCYTDDPRAIQALIDEELGVAGLAIGIEARQRLSAMLGGDRLASRNELRKLALYCHGKTEIAAADVLEAMGDVAALSSEDAVDAAFAGNAGHLDRALDRIEKSKMAIFPVLHGLTQHLMLMDIMRDEMENEGRAVGALMQTRGRAIHFKRKAVFERALCNWPLQSIRKELAHLEKVIFETRRKPALEMALARMTLLRICLISARHIGRGR